MSDSYVCSGAMMRCTMGTSPATLTVLPVRTVNLTGPPMANISDHQSMVNLAPFGLCRSLGFPPTASATAAAHGHLTPMPCMHNTPAPWMGGKMDYLIKAQPALLKSSKCQCMWGGTISLVTDGQVGEGTQYVQKKQEEDFELQQEDTSGLDQNSVLDGIQLALDAAGFVPGFGAIPDLINASISALRGNWVDAGMSLLAAVPLIGDAAAGAKIAYKGLKVAKSMDKSANELIKVTKGLNKYEKKAKLAKEASKYTGKDISVKELVSHGMSDEDAKFFMKKVRFERRNVVNSALKDGNVSIFKRESYINCHDLAHPVHVETAPKGTRYYQHMRRDSKNNLLMGDFVTTDSKITRGELGLGDEYLTSYRGHNGKIKNESIRTRELHELELEKDTSVLVSTARKTTDTWSNPHNPVKTKGGGRQIFVTNKNNLKRISTDPYN